MTPHAQQILDELHKQFSDMLFVWEPSILDFSDSNPSKLIVSSKSSPDKSIKIDFKKGIYAETFESILEGIKCSGILEIEK